MKSIQSIGKWMAAAATLAVASSAYAVGPGTTPDVTIYAGGGSAQQKSSFVALSSLLNNIDVYSDKGCGNDTLHDSATWVILFGSLKTAQSFPDNVGGGTTTVAAGSNVLYLYRFAGGSFPNGIKPHAVSGATLVYPVIADMFSTSSACPTPAGGHPTYGFTSTTTQSQVPDWGVSDEEPALFNFANNLPNGAADVLSNAQLANFTTTGTYQNVYGIAVSAGIYTGAHPKTSFTKQEVATILGGASNWNTLFADDGTQLASSSIVLLDRGKGSGSKAAGNQYFLNYPGSIATGGAKNPRSVSLGYTGTAGAPCAGGTYKDISEGSNQAIVDDFANAFAGGCSAIAVLGLEFPPNLNKDGSGNVTYYFAKIQGVDPGVNATGSSATADYSNVISGAYDFYYTGAFNYRTSNTVGGHWLGDATPQGVLINSALKAFQANTLPGGVGGTSYPNGTPGVLLDPSIEGSLFQCTTRGTRTNISVSPVVTNKNATVASPAACIEPIH